MNKKTYIHPKDIKIPENRQRKNFDNDKLHELIISIKRFGQLQPSILSKDMEIIAGERRTKAIAAIMTEEETNNIAEEFRIPGVWYVIDDNPSVIIKKEIELEENLRRDDLTWCEKVEAVMELHFLKCKAYKNWRQVDTANGLNISRALVTTYGIVYDAFKKYPNLRTLSSLTDAINVFKDLKAQELNSELAKRKKKEYDETVKADVKADTSLSPGVCNVSFIPHLHHTDCIEFMRRLNSESIDVIVTDPMWGVNINDNIEYDAPSDDMTECKLVLHDFIVEAARVMKPGSNMIMFFGNENYQWIVDRCNAYGLSAYPVPLLWLKNNGYSPAMDYYPGHAYEPMLRITKGTPLPLCKRRTLDYFAVNSVINKTHPFEKPIKLWKEILETFAKEGDVMLDGFGGSCTSAIAAYLLGMFPLVCEKDEKYYHVGIENWEREINKKEEFLV